MMESLEWKSARRIAEEERAYRLKRFEAYMVMVDQNQLPQALALTALREEIEVAELAAEVSDGIA